MIFGLALWYIVYFIRVCSTRYDIEVYLPRHLTSSTAAAAGCCRGVCQIDRHLCLLVLLFLQRRENRSSADVTWPMMGLVYVTRSNGKTWRRFFSSVGAKTDFFQIIKLLLTGIFRLKGSINYASCQLDFHVWFTHSLRNPLCFGKLSN